MTKANPPRSSISVVHHSELAHVRGGYVTLGEYRAVFISLGAKQPFDSPNDPHIARREFFPISHNK